MKERLQKIISNAGFCSRRRAEELIKEGNVFVNKRVARIGDKADIEKDIIIVDGKPLIFEKRRYFMFNKPMGYETTLFNPFQRKIVTNLVNAKERIYPVGRLDKDSEGLLILTNDGNFANRVMHPRYEINKTYYVKVTRPIKVSHLKEIERGLRIEGQKTSQAKIESISLTEFELTLHEGRNRIIRKMLEKIGYKVERLVRTAIGKLTLRNLAPKKYRELTKKDISLIFRK